MRRAWILIVMMVLALTSVGMASAAPARKNAPDFRLNDIEGKPLQLSSMLGKVVLLDFWATWCPPCRKEIPHFVELVNQYKGKGFEVVGLSVGEEPDVVRKFMAANGMNYPVAITDGRQEQAYGGIRGIPTTFLIDRKGKIANKWVGYQDKAVFEKEIQKLLAER